VLGPFALWGVKRFTMTPVIGPQTLALMPQANIPDDLYTVTLFDGLPADREGKLIRYKRVKLRETNTADERDAIRLSERVVMVQGQPKLLMSDADFRFALTMKHIERFECDSMTIDAPMIDLDLMGKLSPHDVGLIESRVFLMTLAAEVRYGNLTQDAFDQAWAGSTAPKQAPQPVGQAASVGAGSAADQSGPQVLADYSGAGAAGAAQSDAS
jgi:phage FluMu protein gp41